MSNKRFLVVDSNEENTTKVKVLLGELQCGNVTVSNSPNDALGIMEPKKIEFVIFNWDMKEIDGCSFLQRIEAMGAFRYIPKLIYVKNLSEDDQRVLRDLSIDNFASFPIEDDDFKEKVKEFLRREDMLDDTMVKLRQAQGYMLDGSIDEAMNLTKECLGDGPYTVNAHTLKGELHLQKEEFNDAESTLKTALDKKGVHSPAMLVLAKVYSKSGRHDEAIGMLKAMTNNSPKNVSMLLNLGDAQITSGDSDGAKETLGKVLEVDPSNPQGNEGLGKIHFSEGNYDLAKKFLAASSASDELVSVFNNLAVGLVADDNFELALEKYTHAIQILDKADLKHLLYYNMALAYWKKGEYENAFDKAYESLEISPTYEKSFAATVKIYREAKEKGIEIPKAKVDKVKNTFKKPEKEAS